MEKNHFDFLEKKELDWESLCCRCGGCCGAFDDPCTHLKMESDGIFFCDSYETRFGPQTTVSGQRFECVPIKKLLRTYWPQWNKCSYKKLQHV